MYKSIYVIRTVCQLFSTSSFFFKLYADLRDLHLLTHSFPPRRSSDLGHGIRRLRRRHGRGDRRQGLAPRRRGGDRSLARSEEHTSELQSLMRISYAVFCLKKKKTTLMYKKV